MSSTSSCTGRSSTGRHSTVSCARSTSVKTCCSSRQLSGRQRVATLPVAAVKVVRTIGAIAFLYALVLVATGGFDLSIGPIALRSHDIDRFVALAPLPDWPTRSAASVREGSRGSGDRGRPGRARLPRRAPRPWALAVGASALIGATAGLWLLARVIRGHAAEAPIGDMALLELYTIDATRNALLVGPLALRLASSRSAMFYLFKPLANCRAANTKASAGRRSCSTSPASPCCWHSWPAVRVRRSPSS